MPKAEANNLFVLPFSYQDNSSSESSAKRAAIAYKKLHEQHC
jgi:hypothetical protein